MITAFYVGLEEATDKATEGMPFLQRRAAKRRVLNNWRLVFRDAAMAWRQEHADAPVLEADDGSDTPILDFIQKLIDGGKIQEFMTFLVEKFLPLLFSLITAFIGGL